MKKNQVQIGGTYVAKVSGQLASVRIDGESPYGGWEATNIATGRKVRIKSPQRLRRKTQPVSGGVTAELQVVQNDARPEQMDEPDAAETSQTEGENDDQLPDNQLCATKGCKGLPVMTYLGKPYCQACWDQHCSEETLPRETSGSACCPNEQPSEQEKTMSKKSNKKQTKSQPAGQKIVRGDNSKTKSGKGVSAKAPKVPEAAKPKATVPKGTKAAKKAPEAKEKALSGLDAATKVLKEAGRPLNCKAMVAGMLEKGYWKTGGKTPWATLYSAILREINEKKKESRFKKTGRGLFEHTGKERS